MGGKGFPKQPKELAILKGTVRHVRYPSDKEAVSFRNIAEVPEPPVRLNTNGQTVWNSILSELIHIRGLITSMDLQLFEEYCYHKQIIWDMKKDIDKSGYYEYGEKGTKMINPAVKMYMDSEKRANQIGSEFGFSPSSRTGIRLPEPNKVDPFAKYK